MRVVFWNIRAGGGVRAAAIARQIAAWEADAVALAEFRGTPPSGELARDLARLGLPYQWTTADPARPGVNGLLLASRWPLRRLRLPCAPSEPCRWLLARVLAPEPLALGVMHVPNRVGGRKYPFLDAVLTTARRRWATPALLVGDTNSGPHRTRRGGPRVQPDRGRLDAATSTRRAGPTPTATCAAPRAPTPGTRRTAATASGSTRPSSIARYSPGCAASATTGAAGPASPAAPPATTRP